MKQKNETLLDIEGVAVQTGQHLTDLLTESSH